MWACLVFLALVLIPCYKSLKKGHVKCSRIPAAPLTGWSGCPAGTLAGRVGALTVRSFVCPKLKKSPRLFRVFQSTSNGPAHSQGNGPLCKGGTRCSGVFSACVRRSSFLSTKLSGLSAHRRPSFFFQSTPLFHLS